MRRSIGLAAILALVVAAAAQAASLDEVLDDPAVNESFSSASDGYLAWTANSEARPRRVHSYVMADAGSPVRVNPNGTQSFGSAIDGTTIVYEEFDGEQNDLWFFDAVTETRSAVPDGANTPNDEYRPTLSGDWLLFTRTNVNRVPLRDAWRKVVLFEISSGTSFVLETLPYRTAYLQSNQVNGDWATFESCAWDFRTGEFSDCQVFQYRISTEELVEVHNPGLQQYSAAVSGDGTLYLVRQGTSKNWRCGKRTKIVRYPVGGPGVVIATLPEDRDAFTTFALDEVGGSTTLYVDRTNCRNGRQGIYRIPDADTAT